MERGTKLAFGASQFVPDELIIECVSEGLFGVDKDGVCTFINTPAANYFGYTRAYCIGQNMYALILHLHKNEYLFPASGCPIAKAINTGKKCIVDNDVFWKADGTPFNVSYSANPVSDDGTIKGAVVVFNDISEQTKSGAENIKNKNNQEYLLNGADELIWSVDTELRIITGNRPYFEMVKVVSGKTMQEGDLVLVEDFGEELNKRWEGYYNRAFKGEKFTIKEQAFNPLKNQIE